METPFRKIDWPNVCAIDWLNILHVARIVKESLVEICGIVLGNAKPSGDEEIRAQETARAIDEEEVNVIAFD
jgi:hypothetical protein